MSFILSNKTSQRILKIKIDYVKKWGQCQRAIFQVGLICRTDRPMLTNNKVATKSMLERERFISKTIKQIEFIKELSRNIPVIVGRRRLIK